MTVFNAAGNGDVWKKVVSRWAEIGTEAGTEAQILARMGVAKEAVSGRSYPCHVRMFAHAEQLRAKVLSTSKGFEAFETLLLKEGKAEAAVDMYIHAGDWENAIRVAESHDKDSILKVMQARTQWQLS